MVLQINLFFKAKNEKQKLSLENQHKFLYKLNRLLDSGYSITDALDVLQWDDAWKQTAHIISTELKQGVPLNIAIAKANFNKNIVSFLYFSLEHGNIPHSLMHCCKMLEQQLTFLKKFKQASRYPLVLFVLFVTLLYFIKSSVYPSFVQLFSSTSRSSLFQLVSIDIINWILSSIFVLGFASILLLICWPPLRRRMTIERLLTVYEKIPFLKTYQKLNNTFLFSLHMSSLLHAGISLKDCLRILKGHDQLPIIAFYSDFMFGQLERGQSFEQILPFCKLLDKELQPIFQKNANSQQLEKDLTMYTEFLTELMEEKIKKGISSIQPVFFCVIAGLIIFVYLSLMLPMFQLISSI